MKAVLAATAALLATPAVAHAEAAIVARDVPLRSLRTAAGSTPSTFDLVGLHWRGQGSVQFRTRAVSGRWSAWRVAAPEREDLPDAATSEADASRGWRLGNPYWVGRSDRIAYRLRGPVTRLRAYFVRSPADGLPPRRLSIAGSPPIVPRLSWGADESIRRGVPGYAPTVAFAVVHHTAGSSSYGPSESAAIVRGIELYHVKGNGWNDIGYNFLVDRYGQVFEGRFGGVDRNVVGAHAQGFNVGSTGVAVIGTYGAAAPPAAAQAALARLLAWRLDVAHVDPLGTLTRPSGGNPRFPGGTPVFLRAVAGHRDTGFTACPGNALYARLGAIAARAGATGLPKLYAASASGDLGGFIRFRARLSTSLPWTVTVTDAAGVVVASGAGTSPDVDWAWDAATVPKGRYAWTISAGGAVRPASGFVGAAPVPLKLTKAVAAPAVVSPDGDGQRDRSTISYTLSASATVTAVLRSPDGRQLATLFSDRRRPGKQSFAFTAEGVADGNYQILLTATDGKTTVSAVVPVIVDRTVVSLAIAPREISPNGDGRRDALVVRYRLAREASIRIDVKQGAKLAAAVYVGSLSAGPQTLTWNGIGPNGRLADGSYSARVTATTTLGTVTYAIPLVVDTRPPVLRAISFRRLVFRVDEPALVTLVADGRRIARSVRAGAFSLGRAAHRVRAFAEDGAGNFSRTLRFP
jgi:N-acetylmuramoyl-L-alanine amidase